MYLLVNECMYICMFGYLFTFPQSMKLICCSMVFLHGMIRHVEINFTYKCLYVSTHMYLCMYVYKYI